MSSQIMSSEERLLHELLDKGVEYAPRYHPSMNSDHLPMTLSAMTYLGADQFCLETYRNEYAKILQSIEPARPIVDWRNAIGDLSQYSALTAFFQQQIKGYSIEEVISEYLPEFISSLAFDAFHPLIRLGYAIEAKHAGEVANALAYWIVTHRETPTNNSRQIDLCSVLQQQVDAGPVKFEDFRFSANLTKLVDIGSYETGCAASIRVCANQALSIYLGTRNFFALHLVTATQAARVIARTLGEEVILPSLTGAILSAHKVVGSPSFAETKAVPAQGDHEHMYKYVYACVSEYEAYEDIRYLEEIRKFKQAGLVEDWVKF